MAPKCGICHQQDSKYKCPRCLLPSCSLGCYKTHKASHENETEAIRTSQTSQPVRDRPGTTQRIPKVDFTGFENDKDFKGLLVRYPLLKVQLQTIYGLTLEPGPDEARSWNRRPLPGFNPPALPSRGGRARGCGRGDFGRGGSRGRGFSVDPPDFEREYGQWTYAKGEKEALFVMKKMREEGGELHDANEGMREFIELCRMKFGGEAEGS